MYEKHFGLKSNPFGSKAEGANVFVGPQQAKIISSLQKGLGAADAVVTVTGPVGVGKTTIVNRALDSMPTGRTAAQIGRMHLSPEEVVDLLMAGFGIKKSHQGSIRRYAAFRRILQQQSESDIPVAIVIEDAQRLGAEALAEVEALTAADAGDAASANIILMGRPGLHDLLSTPDLGRLKQRVRLRQKVAALSLAEVQGYLKHSFREAGGDYETIFDNGVAEIVFGCSEGVPRMINTLCATALTTAMEEQSARVSAALMRQVAGDAFGYEDDGADMHTAPASIAPAEDREAVKHPREVKASREAVEDIDWEAPPQTEQPPDSESGRVSEIGKDMVVESGSYPGPATVLSAAPPGAMENAANDVDDVLIEDTSLHAIPELINDTQPELPELQPPVVDDVADIPVLDARGDQGSAVPAAGKAEQPDIESTQTIAQPASLAVDEAVARSPVIEAGGSEDDPDEEDSEEDFDLDAALSPEVDSTNVMPGLTPNFDAVASENRQAAAAARYPDPESASEPAPVPEPVAVEPTPEPAPVAEPVAMEPIPEPAPVPRPVAVEPTPEPAPAREPAAPVTPQDNDLPTLSNSMRVDVKKEVTRAKDLPPDIQTPSDATTNAPAMRDPSSVASDAHRKSDIDALEAALAAAKNGDLASQYEIPAIPHVNGSAPELSADDEPAPIPEITLDEVIRDQQAQNAQLDRFRDEIGSASSLEDISDVMAETLFGCEEFDEIAKDVVANPPAGQPAGAADAEPSPVKLTDEEMPIAANDVAEMRPGEAQPVKSPVPAPPTNGDIPVNESVALRIDMLNAMKNRTATAENVELGEDAGSTTKGPQPEPIERQINTSMTRTLEALNVSKVKNSGENDKAEKKPGGLFSRFKKSS